MALQLAPRGKESHPGPPVSQLGAGQAPASSAAFGTPLPNAGLPRNSTWVFWLCTELLPQLDTLGREGSRHKCHGAGSTLTFTPSEANGRALGPNPPPQRGLSLERHLAPPLAAQHGGESSHATRNITPHLSVPGSGAQSAHSAPASPPLGRTLTPPGPLARLRPRLSGRRRGRGGPGRPAPPAGAARRGAPPGGLPWGCALGNGRRASENRQESRSPGPWVRRSVFLWASSFLLLLLSVLPPSAEISTSLSSGRRDAHSVETNGGEKPREVKRLHGKSLLVGERLALARQKPEVPPHFPRNFWLLFTQGRLLRVRTRPVRSCWLQTQAYDSEAEKRAWGTLPEEAQGHFIQEVRRFHLVLAVGQKPFPVIAHVCSCPPCRAGVSDFHVPVTASL